MVESDSNQCQRINDEDALALFEQGDDVAAVHRRQQQHGDGEEKPEPRQPATLREKPLPVLRLKIPALVAKAPLMQTSRHAGRRYL